MTLGDSAVVPVLGNTGMGSGAAGLGIGGGVLGGLLAGGLGGALVGGLMGNRSGGWGGGYGAAPAATAVASDIVMQPAFQSLQNQISGINNQIGQNSILDALRTDAIGIGNTVAEVGNQVANLSTAQAASAFTTLSSINGLGRDLTASATQALINNLQNFNQLQGAQTLATSQIIAGQQAQNATFCQCCCDMKGLISLEANTTRALINANTMQDLRDRNAVLSGQVSNNEQNQYLLTSILRHIVPTATVAAAIV